MCMCAFLSLEKAVHVLAGPDDRKDTGLQTSIRRLSTGSRLIPLCRDLNVNLIGWTRHRNSEVVVRRHLALGF